MVKNLKTIKFASYANLQNYFTKIILPQKNKSSKVIGKTLMVWDKEPKLNIVDLMALATVKPKLFSKKDLALVLKVKNKIMDEMFQQLKKKEAA
mgnify:FL=1|jgi:hypothetical protein